MVPWVISARSAEALTAQAGRLMAHVQANPGLDPIDVGCSLASRSVFEHRAVVVGASREQLIAGLAGLAAGEPGAGVAVGQPGSVGKTVVVFPGQGAQRIGMGRELYGELPVFAQAFDAVADELDRHLRLPLRDVIWGADADLLDSTEFAQPALFAVEVASFGVAGLGCASGLRHGSLRWRAGGGARGRCVDVGGRGDAGGGAGPVDAGAAGRRCDGGGGCQ